MTDSVIDATPGKQRSDDDYVLEVHGLNVHYITAKASVPACVDVDLKVRRNSVMGICGESGSGKSTLIQAIARLQRPPALTVGGSAILRPRDHSAVDLIGMDEKELRKIRWSSMSVVFQSAMDALSPVHRLSAQFTDAIQAHERVSKQEALRRAGDLVEMVGIKRDRLHAYPFEMSGGMRQRASIALALACGPDLVIMDEPTTAVDVVMQRQILGQILALQRELGFAVIFITHDLSLLLEFANDVSVMYGGRLVEIGSAQEIYAAPLHPYSRGLRDSFPPLLGERTKILGMPGSPPNMVHPPSGCTFHPRCPEVRPECSERIPHLDAIGDREVACWFPLASPSSTPSEVTLDV
jgi:peptide/nickel transport system ATP-binding protein